MQVKQYEQIARVWGLLKYYHPGVADGKPDWDRMLINSLKEMEKIKNSDNFDDLIAYLIKKAGKFNAETEQKNNAPASEQKVFRKNFNINWLTDNTVLSPKHRLFLQNLIDHPSCCENAYVKQYEYGAQNIVIKEEAYKNMAFPSKYYRLLGLFRYWNVINYFFPYKYLTDDSWDSVLTAYIPVFIKAESRQAYQLAIRKLITKTNDAHANIRLFKHNIHKLPPFRIKVIDSLAYIGYVFPGDYNLTAGDVIKSINGKTYKQLRDSFIRIMPHSNMRTFYRDLSNAMCRFEKGTDSISISVNDAQNIIYLPLYDRDYYKQYLPEYPKYKIYHDSILYISMRQKSEVLDTLLDSIHKYPALIIDLRAGGGSPGLFKHFTDTPLNFYSRLDPWLEYPGLYKIVQGKSVYGKCKYKGKICVLVNEWTQSNGEFWAMFLKALPNTVLIGTPTAGADGNVSKIVFPGNIETYFSGIGIYYPDFTTTQRVGITPDFYYKTEVEEVVRGGDSLLKKAVTLSKKGL